MPLPILLLIRRRKICKRCTLAYPKKAQQCPHCEGKSDAQVAQMRENLQSSLDQHSWLGHLFVAIAVLLVLMMLFIALS